MRLVMGLAPPLLLGRFDDGTAAREELTLPLLAPPLCLTHADIGI